jgi:hypothetical protein
MLVRNERLKLFATYLNGLGIALFAVGGLAPLFSVLYGSTSGNPMGFVAAVSASCFIASVALHLLGSFILRGLKQ